MQYFAPWTKSSGRQDVGIPARFKSASAGWTGVAAGGVLSPLASAAVDYFSLFFASLADEQEFRLKVTKRAAKEIETTFCNDCLRQRRIGFPFSVILNNTIGILMKKLREIAQIKFYLTVSGTLETGGNCDRMLVNN